MKQTKTRNLKTTLNRETLHRLSDGEVRNAAGGVTDGFYGTCCKDSMSCNFFCLPPTVPVCAMVELP